MVGSAFVGELFQGYIKVYQSHECLIAFAGRTLTVRHLISRISGHLAELRIDFERSAKFKCVVRKSGAQNNLISN